MGWRFGQKSLSDKKKNPQLGVEKTVSSVELTDIIHVTALTLQNEIHSKADRKQVKWRQVSEKESRERGLWVKWAGDRVPLSWSVHASTPAFCGPLHYINSCFYLEPGNWRIYVMGGGEKGSLTNGAKGRRESTLFYKELWTESSL